MRRARLRLELGLAALALATLALTMLPSARASAAAASSQTLVSLTFDDGRATQYTARSLLASHGMNATFYVNSGRLGSASFYLTWQQVQDLYSDGNEIAGHTVYHADLTAVNATEAQRQICYDRVNLLNHGFQPTDFAYPYGAYSSNVESLVKACGYNSARTTDRLPTPSIPTSPPDPYAIQSVDGSGSSALTNLENAVTAAEQAGGGWVPVTFHDICDGCSSVSIKQSDFTAFLDWLTQQAGNGVVVKTVQQVIGGTVQPGVLGPSLPPPPDASTTLKNASLELDTNADKAPDCYDFDDFGSSSYTWTRTTSSHTGSSAERLDVTNYASGDNKLEVLQDLGSCAPTVTPGHQYRISEWYQSTVPVNFTVFARRSDWSFGYWVTSPTFPASTGWSQATWVPPVIPDDVNGLSFGLTLSDNGTLTVDDFGVTDASPAGPPDTTPPSVTLTSPTVGSTVSGQVTLAASASDNVAIDHVDFLVDGAVVGSSVAGGWTYSWNSRTASTGTHTIAARAVDTAGNTTTTPTTAVFVSNQSTNLIQNPSLESGSGNTPTCWLLGGYGTNTFSWSRTSDAHTGSFAEALTVSSYTSGDRKLVNAQDSGACAPAAVPGHTYTASAWYKGTARAYFFAYYRTSAGSWVFWVNSAKFAASSSWTQASWTTPAVPSGATNLSIGLGTDSVGSLTMDDFTLFDNAPPPDVVPPSTSLTCNAGSGEGTCASFYDAPVQVALAAVDNLGGSGVASIRYTTDGTDPTLTNGLTYSGPFTATSTVKYRSFDNAGNAEPVQTQVITVESQPPTTTITCNQSPCSSSVYGNGGVSVRLAATDTGGSGVRAIYYTIDGSEPSSSNGNVYLGAFSLTVSATVKYRAYDNAGNVEPINTQQIQIDTVAPSTTIACNDAPCSDQFYNAPVAVTLSSVDNGASGVGSIVYTTDGTTPTLTNGTLYDGPFWVAATTVVKYRAWDDAGNVEAVNSQLIQVDTTPPSSTIACNGDPCTSDPYDAPVSVTLQAADDASGSGVASIFYTTDGTDPTPTNGTPYTTAFSVTQTATVAYRAYDNAGNAEAVNRQTVNVNQASGVVTLTSPADGATVSGTTSLAATASGLTVDHVDFLVDGTRVASAAAAPFGASWDTTTAPNGTHTLIARAFDPDGNATDSAPVTVTVSNTGPSDTTPPTTTIQCNDQDCLTGYYGGAVSVTLAAVDNPNGSGVAQIRYTLDGSTPTLANGNVYGGAFSLSVSKTVEFRAWDKAGNAEAMETQVVQIDSVAPSSTISCNGSACASGFYTAAVSVMLNATDTGGSGVAALRYTTDGSDPTATNGSTYAGPINLSATTRVRYRAYDNAGNAEPINGALIRIDTTPPATSITCGTKPCGGYYQSGVSIALTSADADSGVATIRYTTNGTDPTATNGTVYTTPFALTTTTTVKYRAWDNAGNVEAVKSQLIQVDATAPTVTLTSPLGGSTVSGQVTFTATASDNVAVGRVDFLVDGTVVGTAAAAPYSVVWPSTTDGTHTISARAVDSAGNSTTTPAITVTVTNVNLLPNPSLESGSGSTPTCWLLGGFGTNTFSWSRTSDAHTGSFAEALTVSSYTSGDRKLVNAQDSGTCAPAINAGHTYTVTAWYKGTDRAYFFAYYRNAAGSWIFWANSAKFAASSGWTQATWTTPAVPSGATNISVGLGTDSVGSLTMDDFGLFATG